MPVVLENKVGLTSPEEPAGWYRAIQNLPMPRSYTITFHVDLRGWGVVLSRQASGAHWLVSTDDAGLPKISKYNPDTGLYETCIYTGQNALPNSADVEIAFREVRFGDTTSDVFYSIGLWANGRHILSHTETLNALLTGDLRFGFAIEENRTRDFTNVRIPELTTFVDWSSLDPAETPMSALQRAIEGQHIKFFMRFSGTLRVWRPKPTNISAVYPNVDERKIVVDASGLKTHLRVTGGYSQAEVHRADLTRMFGHRFDEVPNPYLLSDAECHELAEQTIRRMEEVVETETFTAEYRPLLEPEDRIETPGGHQRIINSRSVKYAGPAALDSMNTRSYVYPDE